MEVSGVLPAPGLPGLPAYRHALGRTRHAAWHPVGLLAPNSEVIQASNGTNLPAADRLALPAKQGLTDGVRTRAPSGSRAALGLEGRVGLRVDVCGRIGGQHAHPPWLVVGSQGAVAPADGASCGSPWPYPGGVDLQADGAATARSFYHAEPIPSNSTPRPPCPQCVYTAGRTARTYPRSAGNGCSANFALDGFSGLRSKEGAPGSGRRPRASSPADHAHPRHSGPRWPVAAVGHTRPFAGTLDRPSAPSREPASPALPISPPPTSPRPRPRLPPRL